MTCEACCREFVAKRHRKECPWCGYNNGRGWQPRLDNVVDQARREHRARKPATERRAYADVG